jgi:hypothetical protein
MRLILVYLFFFMPANEISILQPMDQGGTSTFKFYYLRNTFHKAITAIDSGSSNGSLQSKLKALWKGVTILHGTENRFYFLIHRKRGKISTLTGVWKKLIQAFMTLRG